MDREAGPAHDAAREDLVDLEEFASATDAEAAYRAIERETVGQGVQVLLFGARSLETVKETHPHYFRARSEDTADWSAFAPN